MTKKAISSLNVTMALSFAMMLSSCATIPHTLSRNTTGTHSEVQTASEMKRHVLDIGAGMGDRHALGSMKQLSLPEDRHYGSKQDGSEMICSGY